MIFRPFGLPRHEEGYLGGNAGIDGDGTRSGLVEHADLGADSACCARLEFYASDILDSCAGSDCASHKGGPHVAYAHVVAEPAVAQTRVADAGSGFRRHRRKRHTTLEIHITQQTEVGCVGHRHVVPVVSGASGLLQSTDLPPFKISRFVFFFCHIALIIAGRSPDRRISGRGNRCRGTARCEFPLLSGKAAVSARRCLSFLWLK